MMAFDQFNSSQVKFSQGYKSNSYSEVNYKIQQEQKDDLRFMNKLVIDVLFSYAISTILMN